MSKKHHKYYKPYFKICEEPTCKKPIVMLRTIKGKTMPVDQESLTFQEIQDVRKGINFFYDPNKHTSHHITCTKADKFRNRSFKGVETDEFPIQNKSD